VIKGDGSLLTLAEAGIASINLANTTTNITDSNGNTQLRAGTYTKTDATTGIIADYSLSQELMYSVATNWVEVPADIAALPDILGYGTVDSLHQAMAKDTSGELKALVQDFANSADQISKITTVSNLLEKWTGSDAVLNTALAGGYIIGAKEIHVLEKFLGEDFVGVGNATNPNPQALNILTSAYHGLTAYMYAQLESQTALKPLFDLLTMQYDATTNKIIMDLSQVAFAIQDTITADTMGGQYLLYKFDKTFKILGLKDDSNYDAFYDYFATKGANYKFTLDTSDKTSISGTSGNDKLAKCA
jgi:hypothetical protein